MHNYKGVFEWDIMYKTHVLDCLRYLHIANIDCHNSSTSKRLYLRRNNPFYPRFFSYKISFVDRRLTENKFQKLIACRFLISFINNVRLQYKKCV
jgi:hypothetical protein